MTTDPAQLPRRAWSPREVATQLGVHHETVLKLIHDRRLGAHRIGHHYRIPIHEFERFLRDTDTTENETEDRNGCTQPPDQH